MSAPRLLLRQFLADPLAALVLALSTLMLAGLAAALPAVAQDFGDRQLRATLGSLSAQQGDVTASWASTPRLEAPPGYATVWELYRESALAIRSAQPSPLRDLLGEAEFIGSGRVRSFAPPTDSGYYRVTLTPIVDPGLPEHAVIVDGAWPEPPDGQSPAPVAVLAGVAEKLGWTIGQPITNEFTLAGTYTVANDTDHRWQHNPLGNRFTEPLDPDRGVELVAGVFLAADSAGVVQEAMPDVVTYRLWFPVDRSEAAVRGVDVARLSGQLTGMLARRYAIVPPGGEFPPQEVKLTADLGSALESLVAQQRIGGALLAVTAAGPVAVAAGLLLLSAQLVAHRRRGALALTLARGASPVQLRRLLGIEGLVLGVPAAAAGLSLASAVVPGATPWSSWVAGGVMAVAPALALAWAGGRVAAADPRARRRTSRQRTRLALEAVLALLTAAAVWQLLTRRDGAAADLLSAAAPVLVAPTATVLILRLFPLPLHLLARALGRGSGVGAHLGVLRAVRQPAGGLVPVAVVLLGTTMAVLGATLLSTMTAGTRAAVWESNGASVRLSGPTITDDILADLREIDGVTAVARIHDAGSQRKLQVGGDEISVGVWLADGDLPAAYAVAPFDSPVPQQLFDGARPAAVLAGGEAAAFRGSGEVAGIGKVDVVDGAESLPGVLTPPAWVLMDVAAWTDSGATLPPAKLALLALSPGADPAAVTEAVQAAIRSGRVTTVEGELSDRIGSPVVSGLQRILLVFVAVSGVLLAGVVLCSQFMGSATRASAVAILRTLGLRPSQVRALVAWELAPALILALVVGAVLGLGLAHFVVATSQFQAVTGGSAAPAVVFITLPVATVLGVLAGGLLLAVAWATATATRSDLASQLKSGDPT